MGGEAGKLFPWREHLSTIEFHYSSNDVTNHLMASLLEETNDCMCSVDSSNGVKKPSLQELTLSQQVLLDEASMVGLGLNEGLCGAKASKRELDDSYQNALRALKKAHELHSKPKEENQDLWGKNNDLAEPLVVAEGKVEKLFGEVVVERAKKEIIDAAMKNMVEKHQATVNKMAEEQKAAMVSLEQKHVEALEGFKKETLQNFINFLPELKANILLYAQVTSGPFDVCKVDFDALCDVFSDQLGFDIHFTSGAAWEEFASK